MKKQLFHILLLCVIFTFVSCGTTYYVGTADYGKTKIENFEIPGDSEGNLLLKRASNYNACAVDTFIYLDGKYIGKIGNGDYWQGNVPEGEHEIETVLSPGFHAAPKLLETYKTSQIDRLQISVRDSETTVLWIRVKGSKFTLTKMSQ